MAQLENPDTLAPETDKGDTTGPVTIGMAVAVSEQGARAGQARPTRRRRTAGRHAGNARRGRSATPTSPPTPIWASRATAICS